MSKKKKARKALARVPSFQKLCKRIENIRREYPGLVLVTHQEELGNHFPRPHYDCINGVSLEYAEEALEMPHLHEDVETIRFELLTGCYRGRYIKKLEHWSRAALAAANAQCWQHDIDEAASIGAAKMLN